MAIRTWSGGTNSNWGVASNWVEGAIPTTADTVVFATSVNCNVTVLSTCSNINFSGFNGTFSNSASLSSYGNVTLFTGTTFSGSGYLYIASSSTLTSNSKIINNLGFYNTILVNLADNCYVSDNIEFTNATQTVTLNNNNLYIGGNVRHFNACTISGTTNIIYSGSGTWLSGNNYIYNPFIIDTNGTLVLLNYIYIANSISYSAGTVVSTGATGLVCAPSVSNGVVNINVGSGCTFNNVVLNGNGFFTLGRDLYVGDGTLSLGFTSNPTINGRNVYLNGSLSTVNNIITSGTSEIIFVGTGNWVTMSSSALIRNNLTFNTNGVITLGANLYYNGGLITHLSGTIVNTNSNLTVANNTSFNTSGMSWNNIILPNSITIINNSTLNASKITTNGDIIFSGSAGFNVYNLIIGTTVNIGRLTTLTRNVDYNVISGLTMTTSINGSRSTIKSNTLGSAAYLTLSFGAIQDLDFVNAYDINSNKGQTIWSYKGLLTGSTNWNNIITPKQYASIYA